MAFRSLSSNHEKHTQKAFDWIIDLLEGHGIRYKISGGLAARAYGVERELADIDIEVEDSDVPKLADEVRPYIVFGPARFTDEHWNLELMTLNYEGQEIDIAGAGAKIFDQETKQWGELPGAREDREIKEVFGRRVPVESMDSLIAYKTKLGREVDREDVKRLQEIAA